MIPLEQRLIYCDERFAVINKIPGELCSFDEGKNDTGYYIPEIFKNNIVQKLNGTPECIECVNRIDRPVSGIVLLALTRESERILKGLFTIKDKVDKRYWAIVEGVLEQNTQPVTVKDYMFFNPVKQKSYICDKQHRKSKYAELMYIVKGSGERYSYLEIQLITGRTHQIRTQLSQKGLHIRGDLKYGAKRSDTLPGIRLHSAHLEFIYTDSKKYVFNAPVPETDALWNDALKVFTNEMIDNVLSGDKSEQN